MSERNLDNLALVSRLLLDQRVLALRRENEKLRLCLFWKDHSDEELKKLMHEANQDGRSAPRCACLACTVAGRKDEDADCTGEVTCTFKPWFEAFLAEYGLTCRLGIENGMEPAGEHMSCPGGNQVFAVDAHFHHLTSDNWFAWMYGAKLWTAQSADDAELQKLQHLFTRLRLEAYGAEEDNAQTSL